VVRLSGTGAEEGKALLKDAGLAWGQDMREASEKIVAAIHARGTQPHEVSKEPESRIE